MAHFGSVRGVVVDALNQVVATSGADSKLHFWGFKTKALLHTIHLPNPASVLRLQTNRFIKGSTRLLIVVYLLGGMLAIIFSFPQISSLLAVGLDDFSVVIFDFDTKKVVRKLTNTAFTTGCTAKIMDLTFSPDGKRIYFSKSINYIPV